MDPQINKLNRRDFLSTLATSTGLIPLGFSRSLPAAEIQSPVNRDAGDRAGTPARAPAKEIYRIHSLTERALLETYTVVLEEACRYADQDWKTSSFDPAAGYWGDGVGDGNGGIRTVASMLLACATLLKFDDGLDASARRDLFSKSAAALRYATATHRTGTQKCTDGSQWGATENFGRGSWQSGMWTGTLAFGVWLIWDKLDASLQQAFQRVIAWECDILSHRLPPNGFSLDTKAEENGWEVPCLALGELMFPSHPHAAAWHEAALLYMMNTLCTEGDTHDATPVDGQPVNEWVKGANLYPDFTLENHNIFHPAYVACSCYFLTQAVMYYTFGSKPVPQSATHHLMDTWRMFETIILPWGEVAYPQGMDWELHGLPYLNLYASLATHNHDSLAAHMEQCSLQYLRAWQLMGEGSLAIPGSSFGITRHAINAEQAAYGFLAHKIFGPAAGEITAPAAAAREQGVRDYPYVDFIAHRTLKKFASFSFKNRIMGQLIPIGEGHQGSPDFTVPIQNGFVGSFELDPPGDPKTRNKITVVDQDRRQTADGFEATGTLLLNDGRLQQKLRMISVGSQTVIYEDLVTAVVDVTIHNERGLPVGIENDEITGGSRAVSSQDGQTVFDWKNPRQLLGLAGSWVNVEGRLGVVMLAGAGLAYAQASKYSPGICVYSDILYGSSSDETRRFKVGDQVARRVGVLYVEVTPKETSTLAHSCRIENRPDGNVLHFNQPSGKTTASSLRY